MAKNNNLSDFLTDVADGIRAKKGTTAPINAQNFSSEIASISTGLPAGVSVNGTEITIDTDLYTAVIAGQDGDDQTGKVVISGLNIPVELDPNTDSSVQVTNLTPDNVKKAVTILGVTGTLESGGENTLKNLLDATKSATYLFYNYKGTSVDDLIQPSDTENVITMNNMFSICSNLTSIPQLNTSNVTNMNSTFNNCNKLTSIPQLNTSNVTNMYGTFNSCGALTTIPLLDTSNVTDMRSFVSYCRALTTVPALDVSKVTKFDYAFSGCANLKSILMTNIGVNLDISASTKFERSDLLIILNNLKTVTSSKTLTMGATNLAKLTDEDKAIATNKGWTLA